MRQPPSEKEWAQVSSLVECLQPLSSEVRLAELKQLRRESRYSARVIGIAEGRLAKALEEKRGPAVRRVGSSTLREQLDAGAMGVVYRAWQDVGGEQREVAVKLIHPSLDMDLGDEAKARFQREIAILARLEYAGIVRLYEGSEDTDPDTGETVLFLTMVLVRDGNPITTYASTHELNTLERLMLFRDVCDAVKHAHAHNVLHRDLKPDNILVDPDGVVSVLDFGLARTFEAMMPSHAFEMASGSPAYMSPEQVLGSFGEPGKQSDVYALGVILYELLTDSLPFPLPPDMPRSEMGQIFLDRVTPPLDEVLGEPSEALNHMVATALEINPKKRYKGVGPLLTALDREIHRRQRLGGTYLPIDQTISPQSKKWVLVLGCSVTLVLGLMIVLYLRMPPSSPQLVPPSQTIPARTLEFESAVVRHHNNAVAILKHGGELNSDDHYRLYVRLIQPSYVYVLQQDHTGSLDVLFPNPRWSPLRNPISSPREFWIPDNSDIWLYPDNTPSQDRIIVVVTLDRNPKLESIIAGAKPPQYDKYALEAWLADPDRGHLDIESVDPHPFFHFEGQTLYVDKRFKGTGADVVYILTFQHR